MFRLVLRAPNAFIRTSIEVRFLPSSLAIQRTAKNFTSQIPTKITYDIRRTSLHPYGAYCRFLWMIQVCVIHEIRL